MCGILGGVNIEKSRYGKALERLLHRGPDEQGEFLHGNICLKHARLGILDLKHGSQPFILGDHVMVFNGEIYNHLELREKYKLDCRTRSDAETLLSMFILKGSEALNELDGMFAFSIYDIRTGKFFLARDRAGKKPLYYFNQAGKFGFASELGALSLLYDFSIDHNAIVEYLRYSITGRSTPYKEARELPPGSYMVMDTKCLEVKIVRWWSILPFYLKEHKIPISAAIEELDTILRLAVKIRLESSDLEVGAFLSGGLDSGLITSIARSFLPELRTFTVAFEGQFDESDLALEVASKYQTNHSVIRIDFSDLAENLENILANYGEPFGDSSAIPSYYVSREAKKHLTVILNGDGADELFGGYRRYVPFRFHDFFSELSWWRKALSRLTPVLPDPKSKKSYYNYLHRLLEFSGKQPLECYLSSTINTFEGYEHVLVHGDGDPFREMEEFIEILNKSNMSGLRKIMCLDFQFQLPDDLLVKMDIATMSHSLEGRSPFLSRKILEFAPALPDNFKINGISTKYILRELSRKYLPSVIIKQPKRGFEVPLKKWVESDLSEIIRDYLSNSKIAVDYVDRSFIEKLLVNRINIAPEKRAKVLWYLMALEIWYIKCFRK